jgi:signal peptidase I
MASAESEQGTGGGLWEMIRVIVHALILVVLLRTFLYQPFSIPSQSMMPTLLVGDWLFVSKFTYGYSKYSFPLGYDLFQGRVWSGEPKRGDVIVFKLPRDNATDYIKRLIGLPGDTIQTIRGVLHVNGKPVELRKIEDWSGPGMACNRYEREIKIARYIETLPGGVSHPILKCFTSNDTEADNAGPFTVPAGHYFMMGDNRDNSTDSRFSTERGVGFVPAENLIGRAEILYFSIEPTGSIFAPWRWPSEIRWSRLFNMVR